MKAIGFRAENGTVHWAVLEGTVRAPVLIEHDRLKSPKAFSEAEALVWFRTQIQTLLRRHAPDRAVVRESETYLGHKPKPNVLDSMFRRARIEGVVLEVAHSEGIEVTAGAMVTIRTGLSSKSAKAYLETDDLRGLDWSDIRNEKTREAILAGASALEKER